MAARLSSYLQLRPSRLPAAETANGYVLVEPQRLHPPIRQAWIHQHGAVDLPIEEL